MAEKDYSDELKKFGETVKKLRNRKKLTLKQLGQLSGTSEKTIRRAENGEVAVGLDVILGLAEGLQTSPYRLLVGIGPAVK